MTRRWNTIATILVSGSAALWTLGMVFVLIARPQASVEVGMSPEPAPPTKAGRPHPAREINDRFGVAINVTAMSDPAAYIAAVDSIAALRANSILIVTPMFQEDASSVAIARDPDRCPTPAQLRAIIDRAHEHGLSTALMPTIQLRRPGTHEWRGRLAPDDWSVWWSGYQSHMLRFARLAQESGVSLFFVGSELNSTESLDERWVDLIARVRRQYDGTLSYSANWDRFYKVRFWDQLDLISVSSWFSVSEEREPSIEDLTDRWQNIFEQLFAGADRWDRKILLSELGYPTLPWALERPWDYVPGSQTTPDTAAQQRGYEGFFAALDAGIIDEDRLAGFFCYEWDVHRSGGERDFHYGLRGKPALETVTEWFAQNRARVLP